jgi:hypothetical protein
MRLNIVRNYSGVVCFTCENAFISFQPEFPPLDSEYWQIICQKCKSGADDENLLLCDQYRFFFLIRINLLFLTPKIFFRCNSGYHIYCLDPPLTAVPEGNWFCPPCQVQICVGAIFPFDMSDDGILYDCRQLQRGNEDVHANLYVMFYASLSLTAQESRSHISDGNTDICRSFYSMTGGLPRKPAVFQEESSQASPGKSRFEVAGSPTAGRRPSGQNAQGIQAKRSDLSSVRQRGGRW